MTQNKRQVADDRLDHLYMKAMRCPYCYTKMEKGVAECPNCGISKEQIYHANLVVTKRRKGEPRVKRPKPPVIMSKVRPAGIPFWQMALGGMFGFLGIHCFIAKRWRRGAIILSCFILYFIFSLCVFSAAGPDTEAHPWRVMFESKTFLFPTDLFGIVVIILWIWDWFSILFGNFKYPVVLATEDQTSGKGNAQ